MDHTFWVVLKRVVNPGDDEREHLLREVKRLLQDPRLNVDVKGATNNGLCRPLELAVYHRDVELTAILLDAGADPNLRPGMGLTTLLHRLALWTHAAIPEDRERMFRLFKQYNAGFDATDFMGRTPLHSLYTTTYMLNAMLTSPNSLVTDTSLEGLFLKYGSSVSARTPETHTSLYLAIFTECLPRVRFLVAHGANVNERYSLNRTPLHAVVSSTDTDGNHCSENLVKFLVDNGADNAEDDQGYTAAELAYAEGFPSLSTFIDRQFHIRQQRAAAFAMGHHPRLGAVSMVNLLDPELVRMVLEETNRDSG
jgi:ankyrin repeat protein